MFPELRLALALAIARFMAFLIQPSQEALRRLPEVLQPTTLQKGISHDTTINFIPIPKLRDALLQKSADPMQILSQYTCRINWRGDFGDIGGAILHKNGGWEYALERARQTQDTLQMDSQKGKSKDFPAVMLDPNTKRRYITDFYEHFCWNSQNWSLAKTILNVWPDLSGQITVY